MMGDQSKIKVQIRALRDKTTARGCTEAEAMAAAAKAAELMREHAISEESLVIGVASSKTKIMGRSERDRLVPIIAYCTNTASIYLVDEENTIVFVGLEPWPEVADYLRVVCFRAIGRELALFKQRRFYRARKTLKTRRAATADFTAGMVARLANRLVELFMPTVSEADQHSAKTALAERFNNLATIRRKDRKKRFSEAVFEGCKAGDTVPLNHGVEGAAEPERIGHG